MPNKSDILSSVRSLEQAAENMEESLENANGDMAEFVESYDNAGDLLYNDSDIREVVESIADSLEATQKEAVRTGEMAQELREIPNRDD